MWQKGFVSSHCKTVLQGRVREQLLAVHCVQLLPLVAACGFPSLSGHDIHLNFWQGLCWTCCQCLEGMLSLCSGMVISMLIPLQGRPRRVQAAVVVGPPRCVQAAVVVGLVQAPKLLWSCLKPTEALCFC